MSEPKQAIVVRADLKKMLEKEGKLGVQIAHASMKVFLDRAQVLNGKGTEIPELGATGDEWIGFPVTPLEKEWLLSGRFTKVVLKVNSEAELLEVHEKAKAASLLTAIVRDLGLTVFTEPTFTAVAIGPDDPEKLKPITGCLKLL